MKNIIVIIDKKLKEIHQDLLSPISDEVFKNKYYVESLVLSNDDIKDDSLFVRINKSFVNKDKLVIIVTNGFKLEELIKLIDYNEDNDNLETELIQIDSSTNIDDYALNKKIYTEICDKNKYKNLKEYIFNEFNNGELSDDSIQKMKEVGKAI